MALRKEKEVQEVLACDYSGGQTFKPDVTFIEFIIFIISPNIRKFRMKFENHTLKICMMLLFKIFYWFVIAY